jgi:hypothetical protein
MKLATIVEVWHMMKESVVATDRETVAENLVAILIDNDHSAADIRSAFRDDTDVIAALKYHLDDAVGFDEDEEAAYDDDFDDLDDYIDGDEDY